MVLADTYLPLARILMNAVTILVLTSVYIRTRNHTCEYYHWHWPAISVSYM